MVTRRIQRDFLDTCERITDGRLRVLTPEGHVHDFGSGPREAEFQINDWGAVTAAASRGDIGLGEAYVAGLWDTPSVQGFTEIALANLENFRGYAYASPLQTAKFRVVDTILRANSRRGSSRNIRQHYDVGNEFYQCWLDPSMTYSSALFQPGDDDLGRAQARKYDRILDRMSQGEQVLEVGCGWGGFAERASDQGRAVTGITISPSQKGYADARLDGRADIQLRDYREVQGTFDNIVSIEMIEAVGERYWPSYFAMLKDRLAEGGRAVLQAITVDDSYFPTYRKGSDYIRHVTFPGGMLLSDGVIHEQAERAGLMLKEVFAFGQDYARTLEVWNERIDAARPRLATLGYDDRFLRNWEFYLGICAAAFRTRQTDVKQVVLAHA